MGALNHNFKDRFNSLPVVVDLETSGLDCYNHAVLEVALVFLAYDGTTLVPDKTLHYHVEPFKNAKFDPKAMEIHGIRPDHPFRQAVTERALLEDINLHIASELKKHQCRKAILTGHNVNFDLGFLIQASRRCQIKQDIHQFCVFDTATLSALIFGQTVLARAMHACRIQHDLNEAHSALYDAEQTAKLFCHIVNHSQFDPLKNSNLPFKYRSKKTSR
ncbi:MAG: ribonuclease T [Legionellales bacterium]|nr:ribonuclease T [Legionellales bacterium]|tara:strand:+ start:3952 stop:4605 length:654 start_codon:yes stop_codon:yes gene_type:complete